MTDAHHAHAGHAHHAHGEHGGADHGHDNDPALAELLDLDGVVLRGYWTDALTWLRRAARHLPRTRLLDLGAGSGVGTIALAQRFAGAEVIAVDQDDMMLRHLRAKALELGLAPRVRTVQADLDAGLPALEPVDLSWASMSMHHLADPDRVLRDVFVATRPGGLLAVAEFAEPLRHLPHELGIGRPGLEDRLLTALNTQHAHELPEIGADWPPRLAAAGFTVLEHRTFGLDLRPGRDDDAIRYAQLWLGRLRHGIADSLSSDDLATLDLLLDDHGPHALRRRDDLHLHGQRTVTLARRD
jgi:SAM-dependent methyltransferase